MLKLEISPSVPVCLCEQFTEGKLSEDTTVCVRFLPKQLSHESLEDKTLLMITAGSSFVFA